MEELIIVDMRHFGAVKLAHRMTVSRVEGEGVSRQNVSRQDEWTRESEAEALKRLRVAAGGPHGPIVLIYTRQSVSDFDADGRPRGPSLNQQLDAVTRRPELLGLAFEHFEDADRSRKETSKRPGYRALIDPP